MSKKYFPNSIIILLVIQLLVGSFPIPTSVVKAYGNGFTYSRSITIDHTKVPNTDQSNFPVLVSGTYTYLKTTGNGGLVTNASGYDVGFYTNSDCSTGKMAWETETYSATTGAVNYWVKVPTVATVSDTVFYMCYGNSTITTDQSSATSVWDSNFKGVWHLPNGTSLTALDSTSGANNGTITGATAAAGQIDGGGTFNGSSQKIDTPLQGTYTTATFSAWIKSSTNQNSYTGIIFSRDSTNAIGMLANGTSNQLAYTWNNNSPSTYAWNSGLIFSNSVWSYVVITINAGNTVGTLCSGGTCSSATNAVANISQTTNVDFLIGQDSFSSSGRTFNGVIDEARISNTARSADWIATEYNNQNSPSTFYIVGSESSDTTAPVFSSVTPASSSSIKNVTSSSAITFTTDEALASGSITITRTGGTADGTIHTCTLKGTALNVGAHTINLSDTTNSCTSDVSNLVSGTVYTFVLAGSDAYSNAATPITSTAVTFDNTAPTVAITYSDADGIVKVGDTLTVTATFSEPLLDSPVVKLTLSGSNTLSAIDMTKTSTTVYTYSHIVGAGDGTATVALSVGTDVAGNVVTSAPTSGATFTVDNTAPSNQDTVFATSASKQGGATVTIVSSGTANNEVWFAPSGTTNFSVGATMTKATSGTATTILAPATEGAYKLFVLDVAGNISSASTATLTVDNTAPSAPGTPDMTAGTDSGVSTDNITSNTTPDFTISCETGATVTLYDNVTSVGTGTCSSSTVTITSSVLSEATHATMNAKQTDVAGNVSVASGNLSVTIDTTAPTINNVSSDKADGNYTVGEVIDIDVTFSETVTSTGSVTVTLETGVTDRTCTFTVSSATTSTCNYTVQSGDTSADLTVSTISGAIADIASNPMTNFVLATNLAANKAIVIDTTAPTISITAPADLATVSGDSVSVTANATDSVGVAGVQFKLDGANLGAEDISSTYGITWDSTTATEGSHTLTAFARDVAGNSTTSATITVTVDNIVIPTVSTSAATDITSTTAILNGSIDTLGGENATARGFEWGHTIVYDATTTESGSHSAGTFTASLSSLNCNTDYHFRAYATNSSGTGYGSDATFITSACPTPAPSSSGSGLPLEAYNSPTASEDGFRILINDNAAETDSRKVTLTLKGGSNTKTVWISENSQFSEGFQVSYNSSLSQVSVSFTLSEGEGAKTVYAKFCTQWGRCSDVVSDSIVRVEETIVEKIKQAPKKIIEEIKKVPEALKPLIPEFLKPKQPEAKPPEALIEELVSKEAHLAFQDKWQLLPLKEIREFVLAPLPKAIRNLAQKFPELEKTLEEIGVIKITDVAKLKSVKLTLPGLTERVGLPTEIVFAKTSGELIDFDIALSFNDKGEPQQKITTISGKPLQLVVKPDKPVKSVKGYVVFKSKASQPTSLELPRDSLLAYVIFAIPVFAKTQEQPVRVEEKLVLLEFEYTDSDGDGIYTAEIQARLIEGEYEIITVMDFEDPELGKKEIRLTTVVDPEGYIYERIKNQELRITGAIVSLYWLNPETKQYELWSAKEYQQENPQTTDVRGTYSFLVPEGYYYLKVETPGYLVYDGKPFQVKEGSGIHINIELKTKYWWLNIVDWKTILLAVVIILLLYNFYRDKIRERVLKLKA